jgi:DNA-binding transcriptional ArsR family regulator
VADEKPEEETYSLIYTSLKHPVRRKILRMLKNEPLAFSEILESLGIDSGHLNYHLESLGDLIMHSQDGKYQLSSVGSAAVRLMGGVEEHSQELSRPKVKLTRIFAKVYPLILSCAMIIASLYFFSYTTSVTNVTNGVGLVRVLSVANVTAVNLPTSIHQTVLILPVNATMNWFVLNLTLAPLNVTTSGGQLEKPYLYYGIAGLIIGLVYPAVFMIEPLRNLRRKPKPQIDAKAEKPT